MLFSKSYHYPQATIVYSLLLWAFLCSQCNNKPDPAKLIEPFQTVPSAKPFVASTGKIYKTKTVFHLQYNNQFIEADRFSSWKQESKRDSVLPAQFHYTTKIAGKKDSEEVNLNRYLIPARVGEQYRFPIKGKAKVWLNASTRVWLSFTAGLFSEIMLINGESYIEALDDITIALEDSLQIACTRGSQLNIKNDSIDPAIVISLVRGSITINSKYGLRIIKSKIKDSGRRLHLYRENGVGQYDDVDADKIGRWREAGFISLQDESFPSTMQTIDRWYNTHTYHMGYSSTAQIKFTIPYSAPLDSVLKVMESIMPVKLKRNNDSIFVIPVKE